MASLYKKLGPLGPVFIFMLTALLLFTLNRVILGIACSLKKLKSFLYSNLPKRHHKHFYLMRIGILQNKLITKLSIKLTSIPKLTMISLLAKATLPQPSM